MCSQIYVTVNIQNVPCGSNVGMESTAPMVNAIVTNALVHAISHISHMPPQIFQIMHFF